MDLGGSGRNNLARNNLPLLAFRYYRDNATGQCERCNKNCRTCQGPQPTDCLSCDKFFYLLRSKGECHRTCPAHYYGEHITQTCERCHPTCDTCKGENGCVNGQIKNISILLAPSPSPSPRPWDFPNVVLKYQCPLFARSFCILLLMDVAPATSYHRVPIVKLANAS